MELEVPRITFHSSVFLLSELLMTGILSELELLRSQKEEQTERYETFLRAQSGLGQVVLLSEALSRAGDTQVTPLL